MADSGNVRSDTMIDWRRLRPMRAVEPGAPEYAWRPEAWNGGPRIAAMIEGGMGPLVVTGPPGTGKTTELAAAVHALHKKAISIYLPTERFSERAEASEARIATGVLSHVMKRLGERGFEPSSELRPLLNGERSAGARDTVELLRRVLREARQKLRYRIVLIVDGLNLFDAEFARAMAMLFRLLAREVSLVTVVSPATLVGPEATELVGSYRIVPIGATPVLLELPGSAPTDAWKFLSAIALQRLGLTGWPENVDRYAYKAALCSGGIPRQFLLFLQDAVSFSFVAKHRRLMRGDMRVTYRQNHEAAIRLLRDGDLPALEKAKNTNGAEMPLDTRRRLLDLGLMLEYESDGKTVVLPHPILTEYTVSPHVDGAFL